MNDLTTKLRASADLSKEDVTAAVTALLDDGVGEGIKGFDLRQLVRPEPQHPGQRQTQGAEHPDLEKLPSTPGGTDVGVVSLTIAMHFHDDGVGFGDETGVSGPGCLKITKLCPSDLARGTAAPGGRSPPQSTF